MRRLWVLALLLCAASVSAQNVYPPLVSTTTFAGLGSTANNGTIRYCRDCDATDPCTGSGVGAFALRVNGAWQCAAGGGGASGLSEPVTFSQNWCMEGATANDFESCIALTDPTADRTWTMPDASGDVAVIASQGFPARTAAATWATRCLAAGTGIAVANECGIAGNPTIALDTAVTFLRASGLASALPATCGGGRDWYNETDTGQLKFCQSDDNWICVNCGGARDPFTTVEMYEDFLASTNNTTGRVGDFGWSFSNIGSPTGNAVTGNSGTPHNPVWVVLDDGTGDNTGQALNLAETNGFLLSVGSDHYWEYKALVRVGVSGDATGQAIWVGVSNNTPLAATASVSFMYDTDHSHTTWIAKVCDSSTAGCQSAGDDTNQDSHDTGVTVSDDTWYAFRITYHPTAGPGGTKIVTWQINGGTIITGCSSGCDTTVANFPTTPGNIRFGLVNRDTSEEHIGIDAVYYLATGLTRF